MSLAMLQKQGKNFFEYPCPSSTLDIYLVKEVSTDRNGSAHRLQDVGKWVLHCTIKNYGRYVLLHFNKIKHIATVLERIPHKSRACAAALFYTIIERRISDFRSIRCYLRRSYEMRSNASQTSVERKMV